VSSPPRSVPGRSTDHLRVAFERRIPEWLQYRLDSYNSEADRFVARQAAPIFGFLIPLACVCLDELDRRHWDMLGYEVVATKAVE